MREITSSMPAWLPIASVVLFSPLASGCHKPSHEVVCAGAMLRMAQFTSDYPPPPLGEESQTTLAMKHMIYFLGKAKGDLIVNQQAAVHVAQNMWFRHHPYDARDCNILVEKAQVH